jgi:hypothetical protein
MTDLDPAASSITPDPKPTESPYEPVADAAPATLVQSPGPLVPRRSVRWPIAIGAVALVVAVSVAVAILITGRAPSAKVLGYVPAESIMYGEVRLDLPGDQRMALASFLSKFPGFADQAAIDGKLDEVLDRFIADATGGQQTYSGNIKPWFDGQLAFSVGALPDPSALNTNDPTGLNGGHFLVLVSVKDEAGVTNWFKGIATKTGVTMSDEAYNGANLTLLSSGSSPQGAFAVLGAKVAVIGDVASVKAAVDTKGGGPFASQADPKAALAATDADHVGFVYLALGPLVDWSTKMSQATGSSGSLGMDLSSGALRGLIPNWEALALRFEGDAIVLQAVSPTPASNVGPTESRSSPLTDHVPASALLVAVNHDVGATLIKTLDVYRSEPSFKSVVASIDQALGFLGGKGAIGWIGDTGIVVNQAAGSVEGGLVIVPTDRAAAESTFTSLRTLVSLGGSQSGVTITDEPYGAATITTIDLGDLSALAGAVGLPPGAIGGGPGNGHVKLAYAITDQIVVFGSGSEFVKHVLDTTTATSIASTDRYKALVGRAGDGVQVVFMDITAIRGLIETTLASVSPSAVASYEQEVKPFLAPFDALVISGAVKGDLSTANFIVTVK